MTVPLSLRQAAPQQTPGIQAAVRDRIIEGGAYTVARDPIYNGTAGINWDYMPAAIAGQTEFAANSTQTGSNLQTVEDLAMSKVGGGAAYAQPSPMGGTAAY